MKVVAMLDPNFKVAIQRLYKTMLPAQVAFKVKKIVKTMDIEIEVLDLLRKELLSKHGNKGPTDELVLDENGNVQFQPEEMEKFVAAYNELLSKEVPLPTIAIGEIKDILFTAEELEGCGPIIRE